MTYKKAVRVQMLSQLQKGNSFRTKKRKWKKIFGGRDLLLPIGKNIRTCKNEDIDLKQCTFTFLLNVNTYFYSSFTSKMWNTVTLSLFCIRADSLTILRDRGQPAIRITHCRGTTPLWSCQSSAASSWKKSLIPFFKRELPSCHSKDKHRSILIFSKFWKMPLVRTKGDLDTDKHWIFLKFAFIHCSNHSSKCSSRTLLNLTSRCQIHTCTYIHCALHVQPTLQNTRSRTQKGFHWKSSNTRCSWQKHYIKWLNPKNCFQSTVRGRQDTP